MFRIVSALLAAAMAVACQEANEPQQEVLRPVCVHEPASAVQERSLPGKARAGTEAELSFKVSAQIRTLLMASS
jgi:hypothetical protein